MAHFLQKYKWPLLIGINTLPFVLDVLLYMTGCSDDLFLFIPVFAGLTFLNYRSCGKVLHFVALQLYILLCLGCAGYASTCLYYAHISHDGLTPVVGMLFVFLEAFVVVIVTTIFALEKRAGGKR